MMENIERIIALVISIISVATMIHKVGFKNNKDRLEGYYNRVLSPFLKAYHNNKSINAINFLKPIIKRDDDDIPKYVFYLIDEKRPQELKKVLLFDYADIYKNDLNRMIRITEAISKLISYLLFFMSIYSLVTGVFMLETSIFTLSSNILIGFLEGIGLYTFITNNITCIVKIVTGLVLFVLSLIILCAVKLLIKDTYTLEKKRMEKMVAKKIEKCDNRLNYYYI